MQQVWLEEMTEGLFEEGDEGLSEGERSDGDGELPLAKRPIRAEDKKTKSQRRKESERKEEVRDGKRVAGRWCDQCDMLWFSGKEKGG